MSDRISKYVSLKEAIRSRTASKFNIDNTPITDRHLEAMKNVATKVFDPTREHFGVPVGVSSFYRSPDLNRKVGGSKTSQHCNGEAMDLDADMFGKITNRQIYEYIRDNLEWDQMIWEYGNDDEPSWVHVSYKLNGKNKKELLRTVPYVDSAGRKRVRYKFWK
jgi:zinc D-Ala-D-Ala carboxypeptidase